MSFLLANLLIGQQISTKPLISLTFFIGKGLASTNVSCDSCYDVSSDHSPIILHLEKDIKRNAPPCYLHNSKTDWLLFENFAEDTIDTNVILKTEDDIIASVEHFNTCVQNAAWNSLLIFVRTIPQYFRQIALI